MPRRKFINPPPQHNAQVADAMAVWSGASKPKRPRQLRGPSEKQRDAFFSEASDMMKTDQWRAGQPDHFVALYAQLHERVYKVFPLELETPQWTLARAAAKTCLEKDFGGDGDMMSDFMRWCWRREAQDEKKRREGIKEGDFRISWRYQFCTRLVTDYRIAMARGASHGRNK